MTTIATHWRVAGRPVTVAEYRAFCDATGRAMPEQPVTWTDEHPVIRVTAYDADAYCAWMTDQGAPCRLPTDEEWQAAAEERDWRVVPDTASPGVSVWEWTSTVEDDHPAWRVIRGGSFVFVRQWARCAYRLWRAPDCSLNSRGFRVVAPEEVE